MIDSERLDSLLLDLLRISSPSRKEHAVAERLRREMETLGAEVTVDDAGGKVGGTTGNVIARVPGRAAAAPAPPLGPQSIGRIKALARGFRSRWGPPPPGVRRIARQEHGRCYRANEEPVKGERR